MTKLLVSTAMLSLAFAPISRAEPARYEIDPQHFSIAFSAMHIGYQRQMGMFLEGGGSFLFDEETRELSDLVVTIDATSVFTDHKARDDHLRSGDFLDAAAHPVIRYVMTGAEKTGENTGIIHGDLTVRGVTRPTSVNVTLNKIGAYPWGDNHVIGVSAKATIERSDFGSTYALDGDLVGDTVDLTFEIEAIRQD